VIPREYLEQAQVTNWPLRIALVAVVIAVIGLVVWAMWRGWQGRLRRQSDLPWPAETGDGPWTIDAPGMFLGTSRAGDWLDRIVIADLGVPSRGTIHSGQSGLWIERIGARSVFIPAGAVVGVRLDRGVAGTVREKEGVLVLTWQLGESLIETGFRADDSAKQRDLLNGVMAWVGQS
jgi:hypothetical protein